MQRVFNIFKLNIFNNSIFMRKIHYQISPETFDLGLEKISRKYPAKFSKLNYRRRILKLYKSRMSNRSPLIWNNFLKFYDKQTESFSLF